MTLLNSLACDLNDVYFSEVIRFIYFKGGLSQLIKFHGETYKTPDNPAPNNSGVQQLKSSGGK